MMRARDAALSRRQLMRAVGLGATAGALSLGLGGCASRPPASRLTIAGGEPGGLYEEFAAQLASALTRHGVAERAESVDSEASQENIALLVDGRADLGLALLDSAAASPEVRDGEVVTVGRVYQNYFHCVVRRDGPVREFEDLAGRAIASGAPGSGTRYTAARILTAAGLVGSRAPSEELQLGLNDGLDELEAGRVDAMTISGGIPIGSVAEMNERLGLRLLDLTHLLPALRETAPGEYERVVVPDNTYAGASSVGTVGVANLLLCRSDLDDRVVAGVVRLLIEQAGELVPRSSAGIQFLSPETLISTGGQPLHPAAAAAYREFHG